MTYSSFRLPARLLIAGALCIEGAAALQPAVPPASRRLLVVSGARIYPAPDAMPINDGAIVIDAGKIAAVGPRSAVAIPPGANTLDVTGLFITAGFQNSHVHFTQPRWANPAGQAPEQLRGYLDDMLTRFGFTTVVDTASNPADTIALRRRIEAGEVAGPRIITAGAALYPPDGVPYYVRDNVPPDVLRLLPVPASPSAAVDVVRRNFEAGADIVKLFTGSWVSRGKVLAMPDEIAIAAVDEAHRHGRLVFTHPSNVAGLDVALRAKVDVLAHAVEDTRGVTPAHLARMKQQNMAIVPTLNLFGRDRFFFEIGDVVRDYARAGGQILFGTDVGYLPDYDPGPEYELMATIGLAWREILASLTTAPAARFGEGARRGRIEPGMDADLVVLGSDPVMKVRAFADVRHTIRGGAVIYARPRSAGGQR